MIVYNVIFRLSQPTKIVSQDAYLHGQGVKKKGTTVFRNVWKTEDVSVHSFCLVLTLTSTSLFDESGSSGSEEGTD